MATPARSRSSAKKLAKLATECSGDCECKYNKNELSCKLTPPELRQRKETVIQSLKSELLAKKELTNGYSYKFAGTDKMIDELAKFIKTERVCCSFFNFTLFISGDKSEVRLEIKGPKGARGFIQTELGM